MQHARPGRSRSRKRAVERTTLRTADGCVLSVAHFHTSAHEERGIVLIPPLIGASYILFGRQFGTLVRAGYRIVSLNYRGHAPSEGRFALGTSFDDTLALARTLRTAHPSTPISALGTCSGSLPLFHILDCEPALLHRVVFVNGIYDLQQTATPREALGIYTRKRGYRLPRSPGEVVRIVLDEVFPEIEKGDDFFGILPFHRVARMTIAREYLLKSAPRSDSVVDTPALCCYGSQDRMLGVADPDAEAAYRDAFRRRFTDIRFETLEADHFMSGLREEIAAKVLAFLNEDPAAAPRTLLEAHQPARP